MAAESSSGNNTVTIISLSGLGFGVWWYVWGVYGFWWGVVYGVFWPAWLGYRMAEFLLTH